MTRLTTDITTPAGTGGYLLTKADEGQLAFGSPHLFKATASDTAGRFDFMVAAFAPMTGPPLHFHEAQDDTFYVLEGLLTVRAINLMTPGGLFPMIEDMARVPPGPERPVGIKAATRRHGTVIVGPPLRVARGID